MKGSSGHARHGSEDAALVDVGELARDVVVPGDGSTKGGDIVLLWLVEQVAKEVALAVARCVHPYTVSPIRESAVWPAK